MEKKCTICGKYKSFNEFRKDNRASDKLRPECKECQTKYNAQRYKNKRNFIVQKIKEYRETQRGKEIIRKYKRALYKKNADIEIAKTKERNKKNPDKYKAHVIIGNAVRDGKIPPAKEKKCVVCGNQAKDYHHHNGYNETNALDVIPVCRKCHVIIENH